MARKADTAYLSGKLLLAMPGMSDPRFHKAVIYVCAHDAQGAMGLVVNHVLPGIDLDELFRQLHIDVQDLTLGHTPVMSGGPVDTARGFVLHSAEFEQEDTIKVDSQCSITGTVDALRAIAEGRGPKDMLFVLGYAGWAAGQLDEEMQANAWLVVDPDKDLLFDASPAEKWNMAVRKIGVDPAMLSAQPGRA